ncbi:hypothetical protein [Nostoc sp.]
MVKLIITIFADDRILFEWKLAWQASAYKAISPNVCIRLRSHASDVPRY